MHYKELASLLRDCTDDETMSSEETLMDIKQVAAYLQINEATAYSWAQRGKLPGIKLGRIWRFRREDVDSWLDQNRRKPKQGNTATRQTASRD